MKMQFAVKARSEYEIFFYQLKKVVLQKVIQFFFFTYHTVLFLYRYVHTEQENVIKP